MCSTVLKGKSVNWCFFLQSVIAIDDDIDLELDNSAHDNLISGVTSSNTTSTSISPRSFELDDSVVTTSVSRVSVSPQLLPTIRGSCFERSFVSIPSPDVSSQTNDLDFEGDVLDAVDSNSSISSDEQVEVAEDDDELVFISDLEDNKYGFPKYALSLLFLQHWLS